MQWLLIVAQSLVKDLQENPLQLYLTFLSKFIIVIVLDTMHFPLRGLHFQMVLWAIPQER